jgi:hypothetical protein
MKYKLLSNIAGQGYTFKASSVITEEVYAKLPEKQKHHAKLIVEPVVIGAPETEIKKEKK